MQRKRNESYTVLDAVMGLPEGDIGGRAVFYDRGFLRGFIPSRFKDGEKRLYDADKKVRGAIRKGKERIYYGGEECLSTYSDPARYLLGILHVDDPSQHISRIERVKTCHVVFDKLPRPRSYTVRS